MGDSIGQRQGLVEPCFIEGKRVVCCAELHGAVEGFGVTGLIRRRRVGEACRQQWQRVAEHVVADDFHRSQAKFAVEHRQVWSVPVIAGAQPDPLCILDQLQMKKCSQQRRVVQGEAQSVT
ncbi:hypothetical protein D3C85_1217610 [compost metagenome]